jgi:hypothetical protein
MEVSYIIESYDDSKIYFFKNDEEAISYAEYIMEYTDTDVRVLKSTYYEDALASGFYWHVIWNSIDF